MFGERSGSAPSERSVQKASWFMRCLVCNRDHADRAHVRTRGSGGGDEPENIMPLCRLHHIEQHKIGIITFIEKYPQVMTYLQDRQWTIVEVFGKKRLRRGS